MSVRQGSVSDKIFMLGEKGSGTRTTGELQNFKELREKHLKEGTLFEDENFPAKDSSLFFSKKNTEIDWKRPKEICNDPKLFVKGYSRFDTIQGYLGDCWLVAAMANIASQQELLFHIVPNDQDFGDNYAGIFHFRIWQYGKWIDVVIDDRLPVKNDTTTLHFLQSTEKNEFWSALLEKAYAKIHGSYEALVGGFAMDAMQDFTGGVTEVYRVSFTPPNLYDILLKAYQRSSLISCSVRMKRVEGLVGGHAYSVTKVASVQRENEKVSLIRLRNPWGTFEWTGAWSDSSPEWKSIPDSEKEILGLTVNDDGEFWMSYDDFELRYIRIEICNLCPHSLTEDEHHSHSENRWHVSFFNGEWVKGVTAGGRRIYFDTFFRNPQYRITLNVTDEDDETCTLIVALLQKNRRLQKHLGMDDLIIGYEIYRIENESPVPLDSDFFLQEDSAVTAPNFTNLRESNHRFKVPPGTYCIVPCTFKPGEEGEFLLRVFTEKPNILEEYDEKVYYNEVAVDHRVTETQVTFEQQEDNKAYKLFQQYVGDEGEINWIILKRILDNALNTETSNRGFPKDICRSMVAMLDTDRSGKLGSQEFKSLWSDVQNWKSVFLLYDKDKSGTFSSFELRDALNSAGYRVNFRILNLLMHRYGNQERQLEFEDFIMCAVKLKTMIGIFKEKDSQNTDNVTFSFENWIETTLYA